MVVVLSLPAVSFDANASGPRGADPTPAHRVTAGHAAAAAAVVLAAVPAVASVPPLINLACGISSKGPRFAGPSVWRSAAAAHRAVEPASDPEG
jgi:hypothetical protein